jgi:uncharacterized protein DUF4159
MRRAAIAVLLVAVAATAYAQRRFGGGGRFGQIPIQPNAPYDGKFTFVRLRYGPDYGYASQRLMWSHDYPAGEQHFMKILNEVTYLNPHTEETDILPLDSPELFRYPVAYLCEPGAWTMSDEEAANVRTYLLKGGFLIVDDFRYGHWPNFEAQMSRILPEARFYDLPLEDKVFHAFFEVKTLNVPQYYDPPPAIFRAIYEDNDPTKRIMVMINYNTDISEYWEWSDTGLKPIDESNEAYKIGVNYIIYGMNH